MKTHNQSNKPDHRLHPDALLARAAASPAEPKGEGEFLDALQMLCDSLEHEANLSEAGREYATEQLVRCLLKQARLRRHLQDHAEIGAVEIARPVFIIGFPRTGSTLLHNLLGLNPALRCPSFWELLTPAGPRDEHHQVEATAACQRSIDDAYSRTPELGGIHWMDARQPDECHRLLCNTFQSHIYSLRFHVPSYSAWLDHQDLTSAYAYHRLLLQSILWRKGGDVIVLKCPFHLWGLGALTKTYPDARFIHLHRDPAAVVQSTASMCAAVRSLHSDVVDRRQIGSYWLPRIERAVSTVQTAREAQMAGHPVLDVAYDALKRNPLGVVRQICEFIGVSLDSKALAAMQRFLGDNVLQQHGAHHYTAEEFGLNPHDLQERFAAYRNEFGV